MLEPVEVSSHAPMDMPLPNVDMPLPGPSMTDMLLWICSFPLWICPDQDMLPWICSFKLWIGPCQDMLLWIRSFQLWICSCQVDTLSWICSSQLWICFYQDPAWWTCAYGYAPPTYGYVPARITFGGQAPMDMLISVTMMLLPESPPMGMTGGYDISKRKQHQDELQRPHKDWIFNFV